MTLLEFVCQLGLSLSVGFSFGAAFASVLVAYMKEKDNKKERRP